MTGTAPAPLTGAPLAQALFAPRSVALVGASTDPVKASSRPLGYLRRYGFGGDVYPVNHRGGTIAGDSVYRSLDELPGVPDHAFLMTPTAATAQAVEQCGRAGIAVVTVLSGGFAESGPEGVERERALCETARSYGMRILGPNSLGVVNPYRRLVLTANAAFNEPDLPAGGVMVASQSGSLLGALLSRGRGRGVGFARMVSTGGETDLSLGEICASTVDDDEVTGYLLFLESLRHADRLREFARAASDRGKPVVAYKLGRSEAAAELAQSHTGALAGEDDVAEAFLADCGVARVSTLEGLLEALPLLERVGPREPGASPRSVGVVTTTGGGAAMVVDQLGVRGVPLAAPAEATRRRLSNAGIVAEEGTIVDLTLAGTRPEVMGAALDVLGSAPEIDLLIAVIGSSARSRPDLAVAPLVERADRDLPVAAFVVPEAPEALSMLATAGIPAFRTPESCADVVAAALARRRPSPYSAGSRPSEPGAALDEAGSYERLSTLGVPVAPFTVVRVGEPGPDGLVYPVAVKALSAELPHKSDVGGVVLAVEDADGVAAASRHIRSAVAAVGIEVRDVLVQEMRPALGEVLVGYRTDPHVGPLVLVGAGGVLAELHRDRALRMAPVDRASAREMLSEVSSFGAFRGFRGSPEGDLEALADLIERFSALAHDDDVVEAELNPVLVGPAGEGVVVVDAVVRVRSGGNGKEKR
ncbi:CoA-binding protein [Actinomadura sp. LD22]|uniref:CoA-binding protein n=1 Tax=Actinomadura physcomitrii TaxID=2650748 RepID=A0A6I4MUN9_9ACTN|nr:acetate--CoA ligase [Actinomadura physcomitrii]MWA07031.1 CoA-binding protein [Actinomadura physcomitrii]